MEFKWMLFRIGSVLNLSAYTDENTSSKGPRSPLSYVTCGRIRRRIILNRSVLTSTLLLMIFYRIFVAKYSNELFCQPIQTDQIGNFPNHHCGEDHFSQCHTKHESNGEATVQYRASPSANLSDHVSNGGARLKPPQLQMRGNNRDQQCPNTVRSAERHLRSYLLYLEYPLVTASRTCMSNKGILDDLTRCLFSLIVNLLV